MIKNKKMAESHGCRDADGNGQPNATATSPGQISPTPALIPARFFCPMPFAAFDDATARGDGGVHGLLSSPWPLAQAQPLL